MSQDTVAVVVTWVGKTGSFSWPLDCMVGLAALEVAMGFGVEVPEGMQPTFLDAIGNPLDPHRTLGEEGVVQGEPLELDYVRRR